MAILHFGFWPQETKKNKRALRGPREDNKFLLLHGTKYNHENFGILHSIVPKLGCGMGSHALIKWFGVEMVRFLAHYHVRYSTPVLFAITIVFLLPLNEY